MSCQEMYMSNVIEANLKTWILPYDNYYAREGSINSVLKLDGHHTIDVSQKILYHHWSFTFNLVPTL